MFTGEHEAICYCEDPESGLQGIIAIHSTLLGFAAGGTRIYPYGSIEEALADVCDLSRAMTYKSAAADLPFGGAKAVILADPYRPGKREKLKAFCRYINLFNGVFQTGEDLGITTEDVDYMRKFTPYAHRTPANFPQELHTSNLTARGVLRGMEACLQHSFGSPEIRDRHVLVQGLGKVGLKLVEELSTRGARLTVSDIQNELMRNTARKFKCEVIAPDQIFSIRSDVFCPCATGHILTETTARQLKAPIVAGCANNQLASDSIADLLHESGILYAPDYVINAGGIMSALLETGLESGTAVLSRVDAIGAHLGRLFVEAEERKCSPLHVINREVEEKLRRAREAKSQNWK